MIERKANGQFASGISGNPKGRPPKEREERYYKITTTAVTFGDWRAIIKTAVAQAKEGDATARKFLADYIIGPPAQHHDITTSNIDQIHVIEVVSTGEVLAELEQSELDDT